MEMRSSFSLEHGLDRLKQQQDFPIMCHAADFNEDDVVILKKGVSKSAWAVMVSRQDERI